MKYFRKLGPVFIIFLLLVSLRLNAEVSSLYIEDLSNRKYFQKVYETIQNAKASITVAMYIISFCPERDDEVKKLLDALISAKKRGVKVKVVMEYHSDMDFTPTGLRYNAYNYLKDNGIEACFDRSSLDCMHAKTIVIDSEIVITGSSNWSVPAFRASYETNVLIRSRPLAQEIQKEIEEIPIRGEIVPDLKNTIPIPLTFCSSSSGILKKIVSANDERALDVLLLVLLNREDTISIDYIAEMLFLKKRMDRLSYRRQIKKVLRKLDEKYGVLRYKMGYDENRICVQVNMSLCSENINLPEMYFLCGWNKILSLSGKAVLITMYAELKEINPIRDQGPSKVNNMVTNIPILYLTKKYGMKYFTYSKGIQKLKRFNIIKVDYAEGYSEREPVKITILGIYDINEFNKEVDELGNIYGNDFVKEIRDMAGIVYCAYDITVVKNIIKQADCYGMENVRNAFMCVARKRPDNHKRTYKYVLGILKKTAQKGQRGEESLRNL